MPNRPQRVIVTGGTSGIGAATARRFLRDGARVVAFGFGEQEVERAATDAKLPLGRHATPDEIAGLVATRTAALRRSARTVR